MYYSNAERLQYSGGDCGEQNHPEVFRDFPKDSDTPLVHVHPLDSKVTSDQPTSHITSTATVHTTSSSVVTPTKKSTQMTVPLEMSTESTSRGETIHEIDISDLEYGEEESPLTSSSSKQDKHVTTEAISQGVSKEMDSPTKEIQPVIPAITVTSMPVRPVKQSRGSQELHVVSGWPSLTAVETSKLGPVTGVSLDSKGQVVVFHRGSRIWDDNTFDSSNAFRNADTVGTINDHTIWIIDSVTGKAKGFWGKDIHPGSITSQSRTKLKNAFLSLQVFKFSSLGSRTQRLLALGDKLVPGSGNSRFCKPTSVAVDRSGEFFVADGYCNSRILKFSAAGKLLSSWGKQSSSGPGVPGPGSFLIPHSLALDQSNHKLYVADRENGRVQSFNSTSGAFVDEIKLPEFGGIVYAVDYSDSKQGGVLHVVNGPNRDQDEYVPIQGSQSGLPTKPSYKRGPQRTNRSEFNWRSPSFMLQALSQPHDLVSSVMEVMCLWWRLVLTDYGSYRQNHKPKSWICEIVRTGDDSFSTGVVTTPMNTVPIITSSQVISQVSHSIDGSDPNPEQDGNEKKGPIMQSSQKPPASQGREDLDLRHYGNKTEKGPIDTSSHQASTGPDRHSGVGKRVSHEPFR
ncbi:hypothetical protein OS493_002463 [Desmophyllum pertusum]|uniref:Peptidylamidoglycolate lyase n=1 Tax=Desmophyllum pertusum TaxID=174260 RepID=A0A9W9YT30_9CNID|nr:hypothetical protein OS493_002463 [Desmophyllum pertusum]